MENFLEMMTLERGASVHTRQAYVRDLEGFQTYLKSTSEGKDLKTVTRQDIESYLCYLSQKGLKASSRARKLSVFKQFYAFLFAEKILQKNPCHLLESPRQGKSLPKFLSEEQVTVLFEGVYAWGGAQGIRLQVLLEILYATGMRASELLTLPLSAAFEALETQTILIRGKGGKERLVMMTDTALKALKAYLEIRKRFGGGKNPWLFPSRGVHGHLTRQRLDQLLKTLALKVGLQYVQVSAHVLRHAFASHLLHHGADLISLQKLLGHADISTTEIYTHLLPAHLQETVQQCHPLNRPLSSE